jgi:hypothetical protein
MEPIKSNQSDKEYVLGVYPDAGCRRTFRYPKTDKIYVFAIYKIKGALAGNIISDWRISSADAWQSAAETIKDKIKGNE